MSQNRASTTNFKNPDYYFSRELSWLEFNYRVLHEGLDPRTPLLERLKFFAIFTSNLDEFFMVRVAGLKQQKEAGVTKASPDGRTPDQQLAAVSDRLRPLVQLQDHHFATVLRQEMAGYGIHLLDYVDLNQEQRTYLRDFFEQHLFPVLTPLAIDPSHPFPYISNLSLNLAVVLGDPETRKECYARLKVPSTLPRFVELRPESQGDPLTVWVGVPLEQVIAHNLEALFPGMEIRGCYPFRVTRNADLAVEEEEADDLLLAIEQELRKRRFGGSAVRLEIHASAAMMADEEGATVRSKLLEELGLEEIDVYDIEGLLGLNDLMSLVGIPLPHLQDRPWSPVPPPWLGDGAPETEFDEEKDLFALLREGDRLVHHPYHSFSATVERFIEQAAHDPQVLAIKMTLYRTSGDSPIVDALIAAAENGKQVAVLVELKARFDEANNINWARKLEQAGVHVVYGLVGYKTHTKIVLVVRQEQENDGAIHRYVHIGTGNYNPKTAKFYTDLGLLSARPELGCDLTDLFNYLTGYSRQRNYRKLLVAPVNLRQRMTEMILREREHCLAGKTGRIVAKMNSLVDPDIIEHLYMAAQAGVKIDLIIRGICCLRPGIPGISENIQVISIIGRFLEHSRIFYFQNDGEDEVYIGSADWMRRNLSRRVEAITPVEAPHLVKDLQEILGILMADDRQAWELQHDGSYIQRRPASPSHANNAQQRLMEIALEEAP